MYVIEKCIIPELHILQGFVNNIFWEVLCPVVGREKALLWPGNLNLIPKDYHGSLFEGNACKELLKEADKLLDPEIYAEVGKLKLVPFVSVFQAMDKLVHNCFSVKVIDENAIKSQIISLKKSYAALETSLPLKIHILIDHILDGLKSLRNTGLGLWSEQSGESIHHEFDNYWSKYKINSKKNKLYEKHLLKAVVEFSSRHV